MFDCGVLGTSDFGRSENWSVFVVYISQCRSMHLFRKLRN